MKRTVRIGHVTGSAAFDQNRLRRRTVANIRPGGEISALAANDRRLIFFVFHVITKWRVLCVSSAHGTDRMRKHAEVGRRVEFSILPQSTVIRILLVDNAHFEN
jgi:hypothetical protein